MLGVIRYSYVVTATAATVIVMLNYSEISYKLLVFSHCFNVRDEVPADDGLLFQSLVELYA